MQHGDLPERIRHILFGYLRGTLILAVLYAIAGFVVLRLLALARPGIATHASWLAVAAGILYSVPLLGGTANAIMFFVAGLLGGGVLFGLGTALAIVLLNLLFDYLVSPHVMGRSTGLHPLVALLAVVVGGAIAGPVGMIVAVPVAAIILEILRDQTPKAP